MATLLNLYICLFNIWSVQPPVRSSSELRAQTSGSWTYGRRRFNVGWLFWDVLGGHFYTFTTTGTHPAFVSHALPPQPIPSSNKHPGVACMATVTLLQQIKKCHEHGQPVSKCCHHQAPAVPGMLPAHASMHSPRKLVVVVVEYYTE
jgi:hypothetical protein